MAGPYYVRSSDGSDASDGLTWANAKATLAGALAIAAAGERIWVSDNHAETQASAMTLTSAGTAAAPVEILCGDDAAEPPTALATTGSLTTTGNSAISHLGFAYCYGLTFNVGTGNVSALHTFGVTANAAFGWECEACAFNLVETGVNGRVSIGTASGATVDHRTIFRNCTISFGSTSQGLLCKDRFDMVGGSIATTGSVPTALVKTTAGPSLPARLRGVNLAAITTALVDVGAGLLDVRFEQCKLGAGVTVVTGTPAGPGGVRVFLDNCDSTDTNYRMQRSQYEGDVYSETTIVRTSGASDGTTPLAHKLVSSPAAKFYWPFYGPEIVQWNEATGSALTATVEIVHDSVTALTDAEVWLEVEYLGTSGFPIASFASDRAASVIATPADQTSSSIGWTTTGITNVNKKKLAVGFTPQEKGWVRARVALAKSSYTLYADPLLTIA
jgi:hypothetical protein